MPIALDPAKTWDYILKADRASASPTVFILGALTVADEAELQDKLVEVDQASKTTRVASGTHTLEVLRRGLRGWTDFLTAGGEPVPFKTDSARRVRGLGATVSDESLGYLSPEHRRELAEAIIERNMLTETERKNSSSAPAS